MKKKEFFARTEIDIQSWELTSNSRVVVRNDRNALLYFLARAFSQLLRAPFLQEPVAQTRSCAVDRAMVHADT